ncbi:MAG: DNA gyrase subunit A [Lachnospiraceae bacterium]|nr:DNA gyrase subunit A [Ruminococcus sp.]MCM1274783.1 DNA gyrase subunit A [Lachnospiraceae bacterium]
MEIDFSLEKLHNIGLEDTMKQSFIEYSMAVITSRALPDVRDGFKPVHRRIIYTMNEAGNTSDKPFRKCAYTVGEVLGKYHPHGDASVYDALVRLAQSFSMRYPLIDGHGNFGSVDGDPPAAYRYTEARLAKIANEMTSDINKKVVDFKTNYDDKLLEPKVLPSRFPNLLVNGSNGIAVGMATNIPPHNLGEVVDALLLMIDNPEVTIEEVMGCIKGPDFPTGGIIMGYSGIRSAYYTGRGKIILRGRTEIVEENNHTRIIITEIPYMVNKARMLANIGDLIRDKRIDGISFVRDESDRTGMRVVVELKRDANANVVLNKLFTYTQLQDTVGVIMIALVDGQPKTLTLMEMLKCYLDHQIDVVTRRTQYDLDKAKEREHILEGLMIAIDFIDEVIAILRSSKNIPEGKERLIERFKNVDVSSTGLFTTATYSLTDVQADAIVKMTLGALTGMEKSKVLDELSEKRALIKSMEELLADRDKMLHLIGEELAAVKKKFGDERRTAIEPVSGEVDIEDLIPEEDCVVTFTNMGYIKRQPAEVYNIQKRGGRGVSGMKQRDEDFVESMFIASSHENILFITNKGNMFRLKCYQIPEGSKQSRGMNIVNLLQLSEDEKVAAMMTTVDFAENKYFICLTKNGLVKRTRLSEFKNIRKGGLRAITLVDGDEIAGGFLTEGDCTVMAATRNGAAIRFDENNIRAMGRTARGVHAIKFRGDDYIVGATKIFDENATILTVTEKGMGRRCAASSYRLQRRGGLGLKNYPVSEEKGYVVGIRTLGPDDDVILISADGVIIRIRANDLRVMGRTASGVRVMRLGAEDRVVTFSRTQHDDEEKTEEVETVSEEEVEASLKEDAAEVIPDDEPVDDDPEEDGSDNSEE